MYFNSTGVMRPGGEVLFEFLNLAMIINVRSENQHYSLKSFGMLHLGHKV
jgi:hypothetical protein